MNKYITKTAEFNFDDIVNKAKKYIYKANDWMQQNPGTTATIGSILGLTGANLLTDRNASSTRKLINMIIGALAGGAGLSYGSHWIDLLKNGTGSWLSRNNMYDWQKQIDDKVIWPMSKTKHRMQKVITDAGKKYDASEAYAGIRNMRDFFGRDTADKLLNQSLDAYDKITKITK